MAPDTSRAGRLAESPLLRPVRIERTYRDCLFSADVVAEAAAALMKLANTSELHVGNCSIDFGDDTRTYPDLEDWLVAYRRPNRAALLALYWAPYELAFSPTSRLTLYTTVEATALSESEAERLLAPFEIHRPEAYRPPPVPEPPPPDPVHIFIGHGRSQAYRDLKDHLADNHNYKVETFESGSRAGHTVRDILDSALRRSTIALLVLTAEDVQADGTARARQNVVHEVGLFQGKLGWDRAIVVAETGVELFSNIDGVQQIRFPAGGIRETFGDVLAVLKREFEDR